VSRTNINRYLLETVQTWIAHLRSW